MERWLVAPAGRKVHLQVPLVSHAMGSPEQAGREALPPENEMSLG